MADEINNPAASVESMWDSPIGGAYLIWRFAKGYVSKKENGVNLLLLFAALPIILDSTFSSAIPLASNLASYAYAFIDSTGKQAKSLSGLTERIQDMKAWTLKSLEFALVTRLVEMDPKTGDISPILASESTESGRLAKDFKSREGLYAEKLGVLFANTNTSDIAYYLGIRYK